jgi:hypothetical protein
MAHFRKGPGRRNLTVDCCRIAQGGYHILVGEYADIDLGLLAGRSSLAAEGLSTVGLQDTVSSDLAVVNYTADPEHCRKTVGGTPDPDRSEELHNFDGLETIPGRMTGLHDSADLDTVDFDAGYRTDFDSDEQRCRTRSVHAELDHRTEKAVVRSRHRCLIAGLEADIGRWALSRYRCQTGRSSCIHSFGFHAAAHESHLRDHR